MDLCPLTTPRAKILALGVVSGRRSTQDGCVWALLEAYNEFLNSKGEQTSTGVTQAVYLMH
jgi:hypothetical protein